MTKPLMLGPVEIDRLLHLSLPADVWAIYRDRELGAPLAQYLELLRRWNRVVSLTSVSRPEQMVQRHVAESLACAAALPGCASVLDLGSGAGFPGIPIALLRPDLRVTLAESHARKAAFLREVIRDLRLRVDVYAGRAQAMPERSFDCVCLRAVDPMRQALAAASMIASTAVCVVGSLSMLDTYAAELTGWSLEKVRRTASAAASAVIIFRRVRLGST